MEERGPMFARGRAADAIMATRGTERRVSLSEVWNDGDALPTLRGYRKWFEVSAQVAGNLRSAPLTAVLTTFTIALAAFLFSGVLSTMAVLERSLSSGREGFTISAFLKDRATLVAASGEEDPIGETVLLMDKLRASPGVAAVEFKTRAEALRAFASGLGDRAGLLDGLEGRNPLPASIELRLAAEEASEDRFESFARELRGDPLVEEVHYSAGGVRQLDRLLLGVRWISSAILFVGAGLAAFVISNTIMLALYAHREEIEILRLMGASHRQIRMPYVVEGTFEGLVGGIIGLTAACLLLRAGLPQLAEVPWFQLGGGLTSLGWPTMILVALGAALLGYAGASLAVRRFSIF